MPEASAQPKLPRPRGKRRWWQGLIRCAVIFAALAALAYVSLPLWLPKRYVADRIAQALSAKLGLPVKIARLGLSWRDGIDIQGFTIGSDPAFGQAEMVSVGSLRCEFSPIRLWLEGRVQWAEVNDAHLSVVIDEQGQLNLAVLERLKLGSPPQRLMVRRGRVTVQLPRHDRLLELNVTDLQCRSGSLESIGQITMSAMLRQSGDGAPVTLLASAGGPGSSAPPPAAPAGGQAASCSFRFAKVDIAQLNLPLLLGLPLKRLEGCGSGRLDCQVSSTGLVDEFSFVLNVEDLDAQPRAGPTLPVIEQGQVALAVAYDPLTKRADIHTLRLRLPGIDLLGKGRMHADVLRGAWEGLRSLEVTGAINPNTVAALLSGRLPAGLALDGDVKVRVELRADQAQLSANVVLDATEAPLRSGQRVVKPPGRPLLAELNGSLEKQTGQFTVEKAELRIGENYFLGSGAMQKVRQLLGEIVFLGGEVPLETVLGKFTELDWRGRWEINELDLLRGLSGGLLERVKLKGRIVGQWYVEPGGAFGIHSLRCPAEGRLEVGRWFVKPDGQPMRADLSGQISVNPPGLEGVRASVEIGDARAGVDETKLIFHGGQGPEGAALAINVEGNYSLRDAAGLLACVPARRTWKARVEGNASGKFMAFVSPAFGRLNVQANATQVGLFVGEAFRKEAGQPAELIADFQRNEGLPAGLRNRLAVQVRLSAAQLEGSAYLPAAGAEKEGVRCWARATVSDAGWLVERLPAARSMLGRLNLRGSSTFSLAGRLSDQLVEGELAWIGDDLQFDLPGGRPGKPRGTPLRLRLAGRVGEEVAAIHVLALDLGRSSLWLSGKAALAKTAALPGGQNAWPPPGVAGLELTARARLAADPLARALLPPLAKVASAAGLDGVLWAEAEIRGDQKGLDVSGRLDGDRLALAVPGWFGKSAGDKARARFELSVPADLSRLHLRDAFVEADAFQARADAICPLLGDQPLTAHVAVNVPHVGRLAANVPRLSQLSPAGGVFVEAELKRPGPALIQYATLALEDLSANYHGQRCRLDGTLVLEGAEPTAGLPRIGRLVADPMEIAVGDSRCFLVADLRDPTASPSGRLELLAPNLDVHDLQALTGAPPAPAGKGPPSPQQVEALAARADELIAAAGKLLDPADVSWRLQADRLVYLDPVVRAFYEVRGVLAEGSAKDGEVQVELRCGLNGGQVRQRYRANLKDSPPRVHVRAELEEIMTGENMIVQLAREFPGNTFYGTFSRNEDVFYGLRELVMQGLDARHRPIPAGEATTITEDGQVRGRAAPKFIARFFPGLNLATYRYRRMTGFAEYLPDGSARNDMIFEGVNYDLYMEGTTDADRIGRYEIGAILPRLLESPRSNHRLHQGRVPILKFKALIEGGRFHDEEVSYPLPPETAFIIFVRNNIVYRLLAGGRKQQTTEAPPAPPATTAPASAEK